MLASSGFVSGCQSKYTRPGFPFDWPKNQVRNSFALLWGNEYETEILLGCALQDNKVRLYTAETSLSD